ncbi:hypothetical protein H696_01980 [Fonticula alba]|uniref:Vacuolar protein sorting 55 n=1 Tax=Fonticula alba TaxID=691883 RepID=A0A058ZC69_FONAL|nr:hypothetical protein H696_01980 [Fonticula alba]KCV71032.1 hypothetical protein H696_01980 [Fonticula alba]|eukprot:XP_009494155.1 hypothetical protein H696_01980 [Fonticula alba]
MALGLLLILLSCALFNNWWLLFVMAFYFLSPIPTMFANKIDEHRQNASFGLSGGDTSGVRDAGNFMSAFLLVSGFSFPLALLRGDVVEGAAAGMACAGGIVCFLSLAVYAKRYSNNDSAGAF